eukprot:Gregarina_sp_Poly_1__4901@NODE_25_length_19863_cov_179_262730_g23_i0_p12_GENE_NODE_25_length_19863_cov_179_262730_g23_i0NODE_25_length_19863_cov_179_262730_g23_i0_p12_ORF_typecomplete_len132_score12_93ToxWTIP/PF15654_6/1_1ToxWTIP/PF15654_6/9_2e02Chorion_2/PF03964_15/12_NODE_25_length_19863_cov_179_262730_g23_i01152711922
MGLSISSSVISSSSAASSSSSSSSGHGNCDQSTSPHRLRSNCLSNREPQASIVSISVLYIGTGMIRTLPSLSPLPIRRSRIVPSLLATERVVSTLSLAAALRSSTNKIAAAHDVNTSIFKLYSSLAPHVFL